MATPFAISFPRGVHQNEVPVVEAIKKTRENSMYFPPPIPNYTGEKLPCSKSENNNTIFLMYFFSGSYYLATYSELGVCVE